MIIRTTVATRMRRCISLCTRRRTYSTSNQRPLLYVLFALHARRGIGVSCSCLTHGIGVLCCAVDPGQRDVVSPLS